MPPAEDTKSGFLEVLNFESEILNLNLEVLNLGLSCDCLHHGPLALTYTVCRPRQKKATAGFNTCATMRSHRALHAIRRSSGLEYSD